MPRNPERDRQKHYRSERMSPEDLLHYLKVERPDLVLVIDPLFRIVQRRPHLWIVTRKAFEEHPTRFTIVNDADVLRRELEHRGIFACLSPGGWIQFRKLPHDRA